jgi:hypothetical protein
MFDVISTSTHNHRRRLSTPDCQHVTNRQTVCRAIAESSTRLRHRANRASPFTISTQICHSLIDLFG